jgi:glycopeptide antibiotics resistance protein
MKSRLRGALLLLIAVYVLFILDLALLQFPARNPPTNFIPTHTMVADWRVGGQEFLVNFVGNIVAFMPMGLVPWLARPRKTRAWQVALFCLSLSAMIELAQYVSGRRVADVDDLILNTIGGLLGYWTLRYLLIGAAHEDARAFSAVEEDHRTGW